MFKPLMRMHYDRGGIHMPELGEECYQSSPKIIKCTDDKILFVQRNDEYGSPSPEFFCCCPAPCEEIATPGEAEYGRCYCFSGKVDETGEDCDMQFTATVAGAAVGTIAECQGPFVLTEVFDSGRPGPNQTYCDWVYTTGAVSESNEPCPEACPGNDAAGVPRQARTCTASIWIRCVYNPCGEKEYLAEVIVGKTQIQSCSECAPVPAPLISCTQSCGVLYFYIPADPCGCPKTGTYSGYPYRFADDEYWCINTNIPGYPHLCDPWGANPSHTLTIGKVHEETCKPFNCAAPPCSATDTGEI